MAGRQCYHCKQWIDEGEAHDCWTTTEAALTEELSDDLREAYERLRETVVEFGDAAGEARRRGLEVERRQLHPHHASRPGRSADHRLAAGSV
jgi:hypothetical protein